MDETHDIGPTINQFVEGALRPLFGDNLPMHLAEFERHDAEARELIDRARSVTQELIDQALHRQTYFGGHRAAFLGEAHANTEAQREAVRTELREAIVPHR